ncbi:MAG: flippase [Candidatus Thermoplasmatota archaeon]|nr:flippase [Candidatus Thermoplasmatota archaeon]
MNKNKSNIDTDERGYLTTIARGARIDIAGKIVNTGLRYLFVLLLARFLGAHDMGIFFLAVVIIEFFGVFSRLGLENGVLKYIAIYNSEDDPRRMRGMVLRAFQISGIVSLALASILFVSADIIATVIFKKPELGAVLRILSLALPFSTIMFIANSGTQAFHTLKYRVIVESFTNPILNLVLALVLLYLGHGVRAVACVYVVGYVICGFLSLFFVAKLFPRLIDRGIEPVYETRSWLRFSTPLLLVNFLGLFMLWTDTLMIGYFRSSEEVGIYNTVVRTAFFINFVIISFTSIFAPRISELYKIKDFESLDLLYKIVTRWIFTLSIPIFILFLFYPGKILNLFGDKFIIGSNSLIILSIAHIINASVGSVRYILVMSNRERIVLLDTLIISIANIFLNVLLIPSYGMTGAALATACSIIMINILVLFQVFKYLNIHPFHRDYLKPLISGIIVAFIIYLEQKLTIISYKQIYFYGMLVVIPITYFGFLFLFGINKDELMIFRDKTK